MGAEKEEEYAELAGRRIGAADRGVALPEIPTSAKGNVSNLSLHDIGFMENLREPEQSHASVSVPAPSTRKRKSGRSDSVRSMGVRRHSAHIYAARRHVAGNLQSHSAVHEGSPDIPLGRG